MFNFDKIYTAKDVQTLDAQKAREFSAYLYCVARLYDAKTFGINPIQCNGLTPYYLDRLTRGGFSHKVLSQDDIHLVSYEKE